MWSLYALSLVCMGIFCVQYILILIDYYHYLIRYTHYFITPEFTRNAVSN